MASKGMYQKEKRIFQEPLAAARPKGG